MIVDTSALVAILASEPGADRLVAAMAAAPVVRVSTGTVLECAMVLLGRYGDPGDLLLDALLRDLRAHVVPVDEEQLAVARDAARRFGRGRHPAALNFGDCFSYALAVTTGDPLLCVGNDFPRTDVTLVAW